MKYCVASPPPPRTPPTCGFTFICCVQPVMKITEHEHVAHILTSFSYFITKVNSRHTHTHTDCSLRFITADHNCHKPGTIVFNPLPTFTDT